MARTYQARSTASIVFTLPASTSPGRYGLRGWNTDALASYLGNAWFYDELDGCVPTRESGPWGVSPIGGPEPP